MTDLLKMQHVLLLGFIGLCNAPLSPIVALYSVVCMKIKYSFEDHVCIFPLLIPIQLCRSLNVFEGMTHVLTKMSTYHKVRGCSLRLSWSVLACSIYSFSPDVRFR